MSKISDDKAERLSNPSEPIKTPENIVSGAANGIADKMPFEARDDSERGWEIFDKRTGRAISLTMNTAECHSAMHWLAIGWQAGMRQGVDSATKQTSP